MARSATALVRHLGIAAEVSGSQIALAGSGYVVLALAAHSLPVAGFAALGSFYLLLNTVGRGIFAAVELELTRAVAHASAAGQDGRALRAAALRRTGGLVLLAMALVLACAPLLVLIVDASWVAVVGLLGAGAVTMAAAYHVRGLLAGRRSYHSYAASFWVEAVVVVVASVGLAVAGVTSFAAWAAVFVAAPLVSAAVLALARNDQIGATRTDDEPAPAQAESSSSASELGWSVALFLSSQGVWNLAPVIVAARLPDDPAAAAGFLAAAILLRAPALMFPAVQALLLPRLSARKVGARLGLDGRLASRMIILLALAAAGWLVAAVLIVPPVLTWVFDVQQTPASIVLLLLAASTVIVAAAQVTQTRLIAARKQHAVAIAWIRALAVLLVISIAPGDPQLAGALAQLSAAILVTSILLARWRSVRRATEVAA